jgi:hypothetical protein
MAFVHHHPGRHHFIRGSHAIMIAVLQPSTFLHLFPPAVYCNKFLATDISGTIILVEKATFLKQVTFLHSDAIFTKVTK